MVAPDRHVRDLGDADAGLAPRAAPLARLWSRRIIAVKRSRGTSGACDIAISALVLAGLPTTSTLTSLAACAVERLALRP